MSQIDDAATQELSPSHFDSYIQKSRSARQSEGDIEGDLDNANDQRENETQLTLHEGDEGHIDLFSCLDQGLGAAVDHDSDPPANDFSPTQSQSALSEFPESQRFKTPATAGKKRRHTGDVIETPSLPRNPLREQTAQSNGRVMALSQAFATTQANTSPFVPVGQLDLRSDRPSPNIQLQPQPMIIGTSSPMLRMLPEFQRVSTDPASCYIPIHQSQAERDKKAFAQQHRLLALSDEDLNDLLADEDTQSRLRRRQIGINQRAQAALREASSPSKRRKRAASAISSSPHFVSTRPLSIPTMSANHISQPMVSSPPSRVDNGTDEESESNKESEVETELEDEPDIVVNRSSQGVVAMDIEDKENLSQTGSQVPETTTRLHRITNQLPPFVQESPSTRRAHRYTISSRTILDSSEPIAVANSQPSQSQPQHQAISIVSKFATSQGVEFVPQSPTRSPQRTIEARSPMSTDPSGRGDDADPVLDNDPCVERVSITSKASNRATAAKGSTNFNSTMPETSSNEEAIPTAEGSGQVVGPQDTDETSTNTHFETAVSDVPISASNDIPSQERKPGSSPVNTTPTSHKRNRMNEIAAESSPRKSQSQSQSFNASQALQMEIEFQNEPSIKSGHMLPDGLAANHTKDAPKSFGNTQKENEVSHDIINHGLPTSPPHHDSGCPTLEPENLRSTSKPVEAPLIHSVRVRKPSARALSAGKESARAKPNIPASSKWDIDASPPQKRVPVMKPPTPTPLLTGEAEVSSTRIQQSRKRVKLTKENQTPHPLANGLGALGDSPSSEQVSEGALERPQPVSPPLSDAIVAPNMVLAYYYGNARAYFPALCLGLSGGESKRFLIKWPGHHEPKEVNEHGIRSFDLRVGDLIKVEKEGFSRVPHVIKGFKDKLSQEMRAADVSTVTDVRGYKTVVVAPKQRKSLPTGSSTESVKEVSISDIYLDINMWGQMKDRPFEFKLATVGKFSQHLFTPVEQISTPSTPTSRSRRTKANSTVPAISTLIPSSSPSGLFANMVFAISYQSLEKWESRPTALAAVVESNDGHVLEESWEDLFEPNSLTLAARFARHKFAALLADQHSRKSKYMQALALGIPCLSDKWVDACVQAGKLVDWTLYLLAAGVSTKLDGAVRSRILPYLTDPSAITVSQMIDSRPDMFAGVRAVAVIPKGKSRDTLRPFRFLLRAAGAETVQEELNLDAAKELLKSMGTGDDEATTSRLLLVDNALLDKARETVMSDGASKTSLAKAKGKRPGKARSADASAPGQRGHITVVDKDSIVQSLILGEQVIL